MDFVSSADVIVCRVVGMGLGTVGIGIGQAGRFAGDNLHCEFACKYFVLHEKKLEDG